MKKQSSSQVIKSNAESKLAHATVKEAVQKREIPKNKSSIIPGISVTELKHSLDLLKYALDYSEAIIETIRIPFIVLNKDLQVITANRSFYETFKLTSKQTENKLIYNLNTNAWDIPKLRVLLEKILPKNTQFDNYEVEIDLPQIGRKTLLLNARRTYRQVNHTEAILLVFEDITHRKEIENQKDDFIGIVSHELKTPLTSIKVFSQLLEKHLEQTEDKKGLFFLSKMTSQMKVLTQLMSSFVNVYEVQNGKLSLHKKKFVIDELVSSIVADFQYTTQTHAVERKGNSNSPVYADKERIAQVIINLLSNAIKYSPTSDRIIVTIAQEAKKIIISVRDFGMGIPKGEQEKVFGRFFRVKGKKERNIQGLGLGLYISYEIITQHKGEIWLESTEGKGSTFYFSLPLK